MEHLAHKWQVRIDNRRPQRLGVLEAFHFNGAPYGVGVDVQGLCNGADFPMLGVKIAANLYADFGTDHPSSPSSWNVRERIDETAWPATDRAAQPETGPLFQPDRRRHSQRDRDRHRDRFSTAEWCRRNDRKGRLIRHGVSCVTLAVGALSVSVIEPAFWTPLVPVVGIAALLASSFQTASRATIALAAITMRTDPEHRLASLVAANSLPQNCFSLRLHPPTQADFDKGNDSCQGRN
jgi:hypothetical protein